MKILALLIFTAFGLFQTPTWKKEQMMTTIELSTKIKSNVIFEAKNSLN